MIIGVPKEIKAQEARVGLTPSSVQILAAEGHRVIVEKGAGEGIGALNKHYRDAGADIVPTAREVLTRPK